MISGVTSLLVRRPLRHFRLDTGLPSILELAQYVRHPARPREMDPGPAGDVAKTSEWMTFVSFISWRIQHVVASDQSRHKVVLCSLHSS